MGCVDGGKIQVRVSSCSCSIKRWLPAETSRERTVQYLPLPTVSAENSRRSTFWHPCEYAQQISTVMAFYLNGFTARMIWMYTVHVQLLCCRQSFFFICLSFSVSPHIFPPLLHMSLSVSVIFLAAVFAFAVSVAGCFLFFSLLTYHPSTPSWKHLNVSNICRQRWNMYTVICYSAQCSLG